MISDRAKRLVEALQNWRSLEQAYETAQRFLDEERAEGRQVAEGDGRGYIYAQLAEMLDPLPTVWVDGLPTVEVPIAERIAQTRGHNGETE